MRFDKFTLKAQEVIQASQQLAEKFGHQQIEPEHLVRAILEQKRRRYSASPGENRCRPAAAYQVL